MREFVTTYIINNEAKQIKTMNLFNAISYTTIRDYGHEWNRYLTN